MDEFTLPEGTSAEVAEMFKNPEVQAAVKALIEPVVAKKTELLDKYAQTKKMVDELGGFDTIKARLSAHEQAEAAKKQAEQQAALASNDVESVRASMQELIAQKDAKLNAYEQERVQTKLTNMIDKAVKEAKGDLDLLEPFIAKRTKHVVTEDGKIVVQVLKEDGNPMLTSDGKDATLKDLMNEMRNSQKFGIMFEADNKSGSGAKQAQATGAMVDNPWAKGTPSWNITKQMATYRENPEMARTLAAQMGIQLP